MNNAKDQYSLLLTKKYTKAGELIDEDGKGLLSNLK